MADPTFMQWRTIGFEKNKKFFEKVLINGTLSHAYLFSGQEMIGKRTFALDLAGGMNPNVLYLDPVGSASGRTIGIDEIRRIKNFLALKPHSGEYNFALINDAHLMTEEARNALLKTLEEPPASSILILITANPESLFQTLVSRCQRIEFPAHSRKVMAEFAASRRLPLPQAGFLVEFANGRLGLVSDIIENETFGEVKKSIEELTSLTKADLETKFAFAEKLSDDKLGAKLDRKVLYWLLFVRTRIHDPKAPRILKGLLTLRHILNQPQYNRRLALENFFINI